MGGGNGISLGPGEFMVIVPQVGGEVAAHIVFGGAQKPGETFSELPPPFADALALADSMVQTRAEIVAGAPHGDTLPAVAALVLVF